MSLRKTFKTRRQLVTGAMRTGVAGLLASLGIGAARKRRRLVQEQPCVDQGLCRQCNQLDGCGLPRALSMKQWMEKNHE